jgi:hypothetical protein
MFTPGTLEKLHALFVAKFPLMLESFKISFFFPENKTFSFTSGILSGL